MAENGETPKQLASGSAEKGLRGPGPSLKGNGFMKHAILAVLVMLLLGCIGGDPSSPIHKDTGVVMHFITRSTTSEGCWAILHQPAGNHYHPINLPVEYRQEGVEVSFTYTVLPDADDGFKYPCGLGISIVTIEKLGEQDRQ